MKNFGKLAVLGAALAVSASYAHATPFTGYIDIGDLPAADTYTGGTVSGTQNLNGNFSITSVTKSASEPSTGGLPVLANFTNVTVNTFSNLLAVVPGQVMWTATDGSGDTIEFTASALLTSIDETLSNLDVNVTILGNLTETTGTLGLSSTQAIDDLTFNAVPSQTTGNLTEDISVVTPEPNSLILLGTGLLGAAGMLMRRRQTV